MDENEIILLPQQTKQLFCEMFSELPAYQASALNDICDEVLSRIGRGADLTDYYAPVKKVEAAFVSRAGSFSKDDQVTLRRALVAKLAVDLPPVLESLNLPGCILAVYTDAFGRLADYLGNTSHEYNATNDFFRKDMRFVLGLSIPCGIAHTVDMISRVPLRTVVLSCFRTRSVSALIRYVRAKGYGSWLGGHLESRYPTDFNEQGMDNFYLRIAELLELHKDIRGWVGHSWLHDPQLLKISPRLAYMYRPAERGAFLLKGRAGNRREIEDAIMKSKTRRRLYEEGKYTPINYSMVWPRRELISWAHLSSQPT